MENLGRPVQIQNTDGDKWLITWEAAISSTEREVVSFTVAIPKNARLDIGEIQTYALKRAVELLKQVIDAGN